MAVPVLAIETSCDETSAAVVVDGVQVRANLVASQVDLHRRYGGVVPEVASRRHLEALNPLLAETLARAGLSWRDLRAVAVTYGPGLAGSLLVGVMAAKALAFALDLPLVAVNHVEGHIYANFLAEPRLEFPVVCLVVSGGHTDLVLVEGHGTYRVLGRTRDDAAGEAFDKVARVLELDYPGGPHLERLARRGDPSRVPLPRPYLEEGSLDFSFSGLKTAVVYFLRRARERGLEVNRADVAAGFQEAVVDVLVEKTVLAARRHGVETVLLAGGVAANGRLRRRLQERAGGCRVVVPPPALCTDNAAMIACAA
ncbi:MAG: tRNA (adenosine(37)-N6)-threonylcarbamoyltransferase complex transferase subunit TsaD, partial [Firmicutes bacterium]|nr:tRNA (adenosine(37)-N6)-threonylcarbamoyltransferase complex transferase subunit TsaD [Bacillota bacterium]